MAERPRYLRSLTFYSIWQVTLNLGGKFNCVAINILISFSTYYLPYELIKNNLSNKTSSFIEHKTVHTRIIVMRKSEYGK